MKNNQTAGSIQNCITCGNNLSEIFYVDLPQHIKAEMREDINAKEIFLKCNNCGSIDTPWTKEDQKREDYLKLLGFICPKCNETRQSLDIENIPSSVIQKLDQLSLQSGYFVYCKECEEHSFMVAGSLSIQY